MTLEGTNTWVLRGAGGSATRSVVVDPGPLDGGTSTPCARRRATSPWCCSRTATPTTARAPRPSPSRSAARCARPTPRSGSATEGLDDGEVVEVDGLELHVVATPGHTSDSVRFLLPDDGSLLTGDTVLGRGTSVVAHPDGRLGPYLGSLRRLRDLAARRCRARLLPGHGPVLDDPLAVLDGYLTHRAERLEQVRAAVAAGATPARAVVETVYADVDRSVWPAAELSVAAQLDYLSAGG